MKKNLRIVSAAAAALLAVAPVAATAVSTVSAAPVNAIAVGGAVTPLPNNSDVNVASTVSGVTTKNGSGYTNSRISGTITASYNGTNYSANFNSASSNVAVLIGNQEQTSEQVSTLAPGSVTVSLTDGVSFNFGESNANKTITLNIPSNVSVANLDENNKVTATAASATNGDGFSNGKLTVKTDKNGVVSFKKAQVLNVKIVDVDDIRAVSFFNKQTGAVETNGSLTVNAGSNARMNVSQIVNAFADKYQVGQVGNINADNARVTDNTASAIAAQLRAQNITVDDQGYFTAPRSFNLTFHATSNQNNETAQLPVTVTVPNGKETTPATENSKSVTVMHNAFFYDKNGKRVGSDKAATYSSLDLATDSSTKSGYKEVTISGKTYYKVANKDEYVNASNITGTSKTLKHNAYVYKTAKKRANKKVLKKGSSQTVYGSAVRLSNGKLYYRIGRTQYVKAANF